MGRLVAQLGLILFMAGIGQAAEWRQNHMNPAKLKTKGEQFVTADCDGKPCGHGIAYFSAGPKTANPKTILYIIGGPG